MEYDYACSKGELQPDKSPNARCTWPPCSCTHVDYAASGGAADILGDIRHIEREQSKTRRPMSRSGSPTPCERRDVPEALPEVDHDATSDTIVVRDPASQATDVDSWSEVTQRHAWPELLQEYAYECREGDGYGKSR